MKNIFKLFGIITFVAVSAFSFAGCLALPTGGETAQPQAVAGPPQPLPGTWVAGNDEFKFDKGSWELTNKRGNPVARGTYTQSAASVSMIFTHIHGSQYGEGFEKKWYTKDEVLAKARSAGASLNTSDLNNLYSTATGSVSGNKLTLTYMKRTSSYIKK
jgi:hypothetical protein